MSGRSENSNMSDIALIRTARLSDDPPAAAK